MTGWHLLAPSLQCHAQDTFHLKSLEHAWEVAFEKNPDYQNYELNQQSAVIDYKQSKSYLYPHLSGSFNLQKNIELATTPIPGEIAGQPGQTVDIQFGQKYTYNAGVTVSKELFDRSASLRSRMAASNLDLAELQKDSYEDLLKEQVSLFYLTAQVAIRAVTIGSQDLSVADSILLLTEQKYDEGVIDVMTFNQAKINRNSVVQNLNNSNQLREQCLSELRKLLGITVSEELVIVEEFDYTLPSPYLVDQLKEDPAVRTSLLNLEHAGLDLKLQKSYFLPSLSINSYLGKQQFQETFDLNFGNDAWTDYSYVSLNLSVPIFTGFSNKANVKNSQLNYQRIENEKDKIEATAQIDDRLLLNEYRLNLDNSRASLETFQLYKQNQTLTFQKYEEGLVSLDQYLSVFEEYLKAENTYLNSLSKLYSYYSQIISRV